MLISACLVFFFNPLSYTDFLNGPFRQIMCFSITHPWFGPERLVLLFIHDNRGKRENSKHGRQTISATSWEQLNWVHGLRDLWLDSQHLDSCPFTRIFTLSSISVSPLCCKKEGPLGSIADRHRCPMCVCKKLTSSHSMRSICKFMYLLFKISFGMVFLLYPNLSQGIWTVVLKYSCVD